MRRLFGFASDWFGDEARHKNNYEKKSDGRAKKSTWIYHPGPNGLATTHGTFLLCQILLSGESMEKRTYSKRDMC